MKKSRKKKPYWEMTADELAEATKQYDRPMSGLPGKPLTRADRTRHARAKRKPGRPKIGRGSKVISLTVEKSLLAQADALAKKNGMTRAAMFAKGLQTLLAGAA